MREDLGMDMESFILNKAKCLYEGIAEQFYVLVSERLTGVDFREAITSINVGI